jgi:hypothetical protein
VEKRKKEGKERQRALSGTTCVQPKREGRSASERRREIHDKKKRCTVLKRRRLFRIVPGNVCG